MCEFHECNCNGLGDIWWTDKCMYFSSIDRLDSSVLPRLFLQGAAPCPFLVTPCHFKKAEMTPCPSDPKKKLNCSHTWLLALFAIFVVHTQRKLCCDSFIVPFKGTIYLIIRRCARTGAFPGAFCVPNSVALASPTLWGVQWAIH